MILLSGLPIAIAIAEKIAIAIADYRKKIAIAGFCDCDNYRNRRKGNRRLSVIIAIAIKIADFCDNLRFFAIICDFCDFLRLFL